jgi:phenylalanyl-tRNA synthetase beta chain
MKFIYQDLLNFLAEKPSKELLSKKLFQLGHEHEIDGDIFDMELTPNRGDCLSLNGLARDLNIFFGKAQPFKIFEGHIEPHNLNFKNLSPDACPKISFLEIEIEDKPNTYKPYLENYFSLLGINKTNFFTDISNYISYELGQPTHCFEADSITNQLIFENKACDESFKSLLGHDIKLLGNNCVFSVDDKIVSLAGVIGGESTACSTKTKKVLVECAFFLPEAIIGKSVKYNITSDAAHKFERGVDIQAQEKVLRRFIEIVKDHTPIKNIKIQLFEEKQAQQQGIPIDIKKINKILGTDIEEKEYLIFIDKLGFSINKEIIVPSHRHDISSQNDLAEEIARVLGYNNIESKPLEIFKKKDKIFDDSVKKVKNYMIKNGFSEVINFPFTKNEAGKSISIDNPLDSNRNHLRTSLKDSLLENLLYNERRQKDSIKFFEISDLYTKNNQINQEKKLGIIVSGRRGHNHIDFSKKLDIAYLSELLNQGNNKQPFEIEEISRTELKTKKKDRIFYLEISLDKILKHLPIDSESHMDQINFIKYQSVSEFPSSTRDFSFSVKDLEKYDAVINYFSDLNDRNLKDAFIFDFYKNNKLNEIKVGIRLIFQSNINTLSEDDIQKSVNKLLQPIIDIEGISIPGI